MQLNYAIGRYARLPAAHRWPASAETPVNNTLRDTMTLSVHDKVWRTYAVPRMSQ